MKKALDHSKRLCRSVKTTTIEFFMYTTVLHRAKVITLLHVRALIIIGSVLCTFIPFVFFHRASALTSWRYTFNTDGTLLETGDAADSTSPYFWLNSGGKFIIKNGIGMTVQNALPASDDIRLAYAAMNPLDTANGYYPQNTLRLVTKSQWGNVEQSVQFKIIKTNLTNTPNRDGYSGVFLMGRYTDQYNLYYVGVRQDGQAVIKKKINGTYYTLAEKQIFGDQSTYNKWSNPDLMSEGKWMGLRSAIDNLADGSVRIRMYIDLNNTGEWSYVMTTMDSGVGGAPFTKPGKIGIRTDFMDVQFDTLEVQSLY